MPVVRAFLERRLGRAAERGVDPIKAVACGVAVQAGVRGGELRDLVLVDVTPLKLAIETLGGVATALIPRNTPVPVNKTETFTTAADRHIAVTVHVPQGERPLASDDTSLGPHARGQGAHDPRREATRRGRPAKARGDRAARTTSTPSPIRRSGCSMSTARRSTQRREPAWSARSPRCADRSRRGRCPTSREVCQSCNARSTMQVARFEGARSEATVAA